MSVLDGADGLETIDDTEKLTCTLTGHETVSSHTVFVIRVQRGSIKDNSWQVRRRYNDFVALTETLKISNVDLPLPPKKLLGNMEREFLAARQAGLQKLVDTILSHPMIAANLNVKRFFDEAHYNQNHSEMALQFVSMFLRSEPQWEVVEPLKEMGWRVNKSFFLLKNKQQPKERALLSWISYGPNRLLSEKDQLAAIKLLPNIQHPSLYPVKQAMASDKGVLIIKGFHKEGSIRDILCKSKPEKLPYLKKYCKPKSVSPFSIREIQQYGRQVLEVLKFLHDKGLAFHHLHAGNVVIEKEVCQLIDIENYLIGVPPYYKQYYSQFRKIYTSESIDVYSFGHFLYEMVFGRALNQATISDLDTNVAPMIRSVLESVLSVEACKNGVPTLEGLLSHPLFADETVSTVGIKPQLKIPSKLKEIFKQFKETQVRRLKEEQKIISQVRRSTKVKAHLTSDTERRRRKLEARKKSLKNLHSVDEGDGNNKENGETPTSPTSPSSASSVPTSPASPSCGS